MSAPQTTTTDRPASPAPPSSPQGAGASGGLPKLRFPDRSSRRRLVSLGRAELTLLIRNRTALFSALLMPLAMIGFFASMSDVVGMDESNLALSAVIATAGIGMVLLMVVYTNLLASLVARREERVLKRLRTGEATDAEIFTGCALPSLALALLQCVVLISVGSLHPALELPSRPDLLLAGLAIGCVMMVFAAIATAAFTRTVESAQLTAMPLFLVGMLTSGMMMPLDTLPDGLANVFEKLPFTPIMDLVRAGWTGEGTSSAVTALLVGIGWTVVFGYVAVRRFRWDPRG